MFLKRIEFQQRISDYIPLHTHAAYEFHYIVGGKGALDCESADYPVKCGSFFFVKPGEKHRLVTDRRHGFISQYIIFAEFAGSDSEYADIVDPFMTRDRIVDIGVASRNFFERLRHKISQDNPALEVAARHHFLSFLFDLAGNRDVCVNSCRDEHIEAALRIMQDQIRKKLALEDICRKVHLNQSYFIRLFKKHIGMAPMKYFMTLKINAACNLLEDTGMTVAQIADYLGFAEEFYFSRAFKKEKGVSPSHYRKAQVS